MININFKYDQKNISVQCKTNESMRDICEKFASKVGANVDSKIYILDNTKLNIDSELALTFAQQIHSEDINGKEILVFDNRDNEYVIHLDYKGEKKLIKVKENEKISDMHKSIGKIIKRKMNSFYFLYNGKAIVKGDMNKEINQMAQSIDKKEKTMNIVIEDDEEEEKGEIERKNSVKISSSGLNINVPNNNEEVKEKEKEKEKKNENEDKSAEEHFIYRNSREAGKFLLKIHLMLFIQFLTIGFFVWLGFLKDFEVTFISQTKSMVWSFVIITLFTFLITSFIVCYNSVQKSCLSFNILIYIPIMIIYFFLLSKFTEKDYILIQLSLFTSDFFCVLFSILLFRKYKGFITFIFIAASNISLILLYYYKKYLNLKEKKVIVTISILSFIFAAYINIFNYLARQKFEDYETRGAIFHFNYNIFIPALFFFIIILITAICGIITAVCLVILFFLLILIFFQSLR